MKVSELAKELGYKTAELIELAKTTKVVIENVRSEVDGRKAAVIRAHVPHRRDLKGALLDVFNKAQAEIAAQDAAKAAEPKLAKKKKEEGALAEAGAEPPKTRRAIKKAEEPAPDVIETKPAAVAKVEKKEEKKEEKKDDKKPKEVVLMSSRDLPTVAAKPKPASVHVGLTPEEKAAIKAQASTPLIDVDKVLGQEHEVRIQRAAEATALEQGKIAPQEDKAHRLLAQKPKIAAAPARPVFQPPPRMKPRIPPPALRPTVQPPKPRPVQIPMSERKIEVTVPISIKDFSQQTGIKVPSIIGKLMSQGAMVTINHVLNEEQARAMSVEFNRDVTITKATAIEETTIRAHDDFKDDPKDVLTRAPVVTFMGHVDHGKTSLLDKIRGTAVAAGESGGITQHIGAYKISTKDGKPVVFLDTPGHRAFTAMRARGANVTDVAVIVVAADDGVMAQTEEAIAHAKAANVKIVIAMNKIDKPQANPNKVKGQLAAVGLQTEDWGGNIVCSEVSALTGAGVDHLIEMLSLEAELLELKANPKRKAVGAVLDARKTEDRGVLAKMLVQNGTLRKGDVIIAGRAHGRVRSMHDDHGRSLHEAGPSTPVEVSGLVDVPSAGDRFHVVADIDTARRITEDRSKRARDSGLQERQQVTLEGLFSQIASGKLKDVKVVIKADMQGSAEVLKQQLGELQHAEVKLKILHCAVGAVSESDIELAAASEAIVIAFHVDVEDRAQQLAKDRGVDIRLYTVIYQAIEEMKAALEGLLEPENVEAKIGHLTVKTIFKISRVNIAGCICTDGKIERSSQVRLIRGGQIMWTGKVEGLKRFKDDVREVVEGYECGIKLAGHDDVRTGDIVEAFQIQKVARKLTK